MIQNDPPWRRLPEPGRDAAVPEVDLARSLRALRGGLARRWRLIAAVTAGMVALAVLHLLTATPQYTARAALVVDPRISNSPNGPEAPTLLLSDALVVDSEIKVLGSRDVTQRVARTLGLFDQPPQDAPGLLGRLLGRSAPPGDDAIARASREEAIRREMMEGFEITRDGGTYVIDIAYTSEDPVFAMKAVNTLIDEYFRAASDAALADTRRIHGWLDQRVQVLAQEVKAADAAVAEYRQKNDLFTMSGGILPSQAELSNATDLLIRLRQELIETQTKQDKIRAIVASGSVGALLDGTLGGDVASPALRDFQTRYAGLVSEEQDLVRRWGAKSDMVERNREDQQRLREVMLQEAGQIVERLDTQIETVRRQIAATETHVEALRQRSNADAQKSIELNELEREAEARRSLYQSMLAELVTSAQRETFQRSPARVIAQAVPPDEPSAPRKASILSLAVLAGLVLGGAAAFLREVLDDRLRRIADLRDGLGLRFLGMLPGIVPGRRGGGAPGAQARRSLRALAAELQARRPETGALVCGVTAAARGEGRARSAAWLAEELARHGARVAVLGLEPAASGAPWRQPDHLALPAAEVLHDPAGLAARLAAQAGAGRAVSLAPEDGAAFDLLAQDDHQALAALLAALRERFDHVLVILPTLEDAAELELAVALVDVAVLVLGWGRHRLGDLAERLATGRSLRPALLGAILADETDRGFRAYNG